MERLTERKYGEIVSSKKEREQIHCSNFCNNCSQGTGNCGYVKEMVDKLADYEDAEEQGLLLRLPCKVGDRVYLVDFEENGYDVATVGSIEIDAGNRILLNSDYEIGTDAYASYVFYSKEEAEKALADMGV